MKKICFYHNRFAHKVSLMFFLARIDVYVYVTPREMTAKNEYIKILQYITDVDNFINSVVLSYIEW